MKLLPWDYGVRNLGRRPLRTALTVLALVLVVLLLLVVIGFERSLSASLRQSGEPQVAIIHALVAADNLENSSIPDRVSTLVNAEASEVLAYVDQVPCLSPELLSSTVVGDTAASKTENKETPRLAIFRGVRPEVFLVRRSVSIVTGGFPKTGEILVGRLAAAKLGIPAEELAMGRTLRVEGRDWKVSGQFVAPGTLLESEIWCALDELKLHARRPNDLSVLAMRLNQSASLATHLDALDYFCRFRHRELEIGASLETEYYGSLQRHFQPLRTLIWALVVLVAIAGSCGAINTTYAAVTSRVQEFSALQAMGFSRLAIAISLMQESVLLSTLATLLAAGFGALLLSGVAVRFSMSAFTLRLDPTTLLIGCVLGVSLGVIGALPPLWRAFRLPIVEGLRAL